ncbi:type-F conjugative transfer system mating-pair stabilization protein TraN [Citrobacter amalonaticus]|uniref:type-F conjugative transfer system mating-pair stabilization protein TraN n=1 Tax=Citrobacter amalonaticus TaxID=35703 RepID=UPI0028C22B68|nr:type-F conjugative transfer system mating-pair stabilization protein TraN [Citrobacter amalonaticus]MDT7072812.1 type-F conjugative transfer system mating-pair stabilization protein TraN [Citrobacter amalonaticus]HED3078468.1 type-F conjugative transfer system mating-pair stabilization protein TraN [Citrobacter amalonaticus]HED3697706.1 type-F conjugative transfer system mating-pair stabilization protein TraN [Citrobacter amalonaticus]
MKQLIAAAMLLLPSVVMADAASEAYNSGAAFGKGNAGQGTGSLSNPGAVTGSIPGYTANPPESDYYGGVRGGDNGLAENGQNALQHSNAGQSVIDSAKTNPPPTIDPNAPFITIGKDAESSAGSVLDGTSSQCTQSSVSKTTFQNYSCDRDVAAIQTCGRTAKITGSYQDNYSYKTITIDSDNLDVSSPTVTYAMPAGTVYTASMSYTFKKNLAFSNSAWFLNITALGKLMTMYDTSGSYSMPTGKTFSSGELLTIAFNNRDDSSNSVPSVWRLGKDSQMFHFVISIVLRTGSRIWVPQTTWTESCGFDKKKALSSAGSTCIDPGGTRTVIVDGKQYSQTNSCWAYSDSYVTATSSEGNCGSLMKNSSCTRSSQTCTTKESGVCTHQTETWQCQTTYNSSGLVCGGEYICQTGDCDDTNGAGNSGFDTAVAKLAGLASAADDVKKQQDGIDVRAFTGSVMSCRKAVAGFSNCCKDSGWGADTGLASCNSNEMALGKAKAKKVTVDVGERCDKEVLGVCVQKSRVYCVFGGKLARIIQEQGRRDQLRVGFGSGKSPDCRGITIPELQGIDFDKINFADFYEDLMNNQKIPDTGTQVKLIKDRIAAQVNQQGGK